MKTFALMFALVVSSLACLAAEGELQSISTAEMDKEINQQKGLVVLKITAIWCPPCKLMQPKLIELSKERSNVKFLQMDADANKIKIKELAVEALPTLILYKDGKEIGRLRGNKEKKEIAEWLDQSEAK
jgi:thioredoxin 1